MVSINSSSKNFIWILQLTVTPHYVPFPLSFFISQSVMILWWIEQLSLRFRIINFLMNFCFFLFSLCLQFIFLLFLILFCPSLFPPLSLSISLSHYIFPIIFISSDYTSTHTYVQLNIIYSQPFPLLLHSNLSHRTIWFNLILSSSSHTTS